MWLAVVSPARSKGVQCSPLRCRSQLDLNRTPAVGPSGTFTTSVFKKSEINLHSAERLIIVQLFDQTQAERKINHLREILSSFPTLCVHYTSVLTRSGNIKCHPMELVFHCFPSPRQWPTCGMSDGGYSLQVLILLT
jgi:hypothetical protein